jgi:hypothetical protein
MADGSAADLCDDLRANLIPWLVVIQAMMTAYFHDEVGKSAPPTTGAS